MKVDRFVFAVSRESFRCSLRTCAFLSQSGATAVRRASRLHLADRIMEDIKEMTLLYIRRARLHNAPSAPRKEAWVSLSHHIGPRHQHLSTTQTPQGSTWRRLCAERQCLIDWF